MLGPHPLTHSVPVGSRSYTEKSSHHSPIIPNLTHGAQTKGTLTRLKAENHGDQEAGRTNGMEGVDLN